MENHVNLRKYLSSIGLTTTEINAFMDQEAKNLIVIEKLLDHAEKQGFKKAVMQVIKRAFDISELCMEIAIDENKIVCAID